MRLLLEWLWRLPAYFLGGWGAVASLLLLIALWDVLAVHFGPLILPTPLETFQTMLTMAQTDSASWLMHVGATARRAFAGLVIALGVGSVAGAMVGRSMTAILLVRPWLTVLLGTPPIAWLVMAMLWFGTEDGTPLFTVVVACLPVVFVAAMQGARTLDGAWGHVADAMALPWWLRLRAIVVPHMASYLFPAWTVALASAWKVVVMAELLASSTGVGAQLAASRSQLDMAASIAWIALVVGILLAVEYLLLEPIKRGMEAWRVDTHD